MFVVTEAEATAIRSVFEQRGEFGTGVRPYHRWLEAAAAAGGEAGAAATAGALTPRPARHPPCRQRLHGPWRYTAATSRNKSLAWGVDSDQVSLETNRGRVRPDGCGGSF